MHRNAVWLCLVALLATPAAAIAHVPYLERVDLTENKPFIDADIAQSIAVYAWLDPQSTAGDLDIYSFIVTDPVDVYLNVIVPVCDGYESLAPWFALVGPGLPDATELVPFEIPPGQGAIVVPNNIEPGVLRPKFYEPFGGKWYWDGPEITYPISEPGSYRVYYWDPNQEAGDYAAVLGDKEIWRLPDILRALAVTPLIRQDKELHIECLPPTPGDDDLADDDVADDDALDDDASDDDASDDDVLDDDQSDDDTPDGGDQADDENGGDADGCGA